MQIVIFKFVSFGILQSGGQTVFNFVSVLMEGG
jgi:hypothetical protein